MIEEVRLIDADALINEIDAWMKRISLEDNAVANAVFDTLQSVAEMVIDANEIDAEPVRHGRWIGIEGDGYADGLPVYDVWECSECGDEWHGEDTPCYCLNCGAKMDLEGTE